ncbi:chlororespiratory reduction 6 domain-containing protein [Azovibrio restrictus]|uniref:chlororespiratory reduction 6 domain-containing protein n=1 Tax=Azovibrio restrictus TaxID=146938 RepID=UPI0026F037B7|nr:chlororespiratory reduction 6 domain-containing protein [Azovibrio restrictus]
MRVMLTDADGLANNSEPALIVLDITRREIESGNIASALERLHVLTDSAESVRRYRESLVFQIGGYDSDPRELPDIPEVRAFFRRLAAEWPHWMWFLHRGVGAVGLLLALLCDVRVVRGAGSYGTEFLNQAQLAAAVADLLDRGNALFATYGITAEEAAESADSAAAELLGEKA